ncbi:MAG TPA: DUF4430 domain-containing protein [Firmicutes bacterium]|nr:DUF4430 domain-containing protein [Bacillota bacterium]
MSKSRFTLGIFLIIILISLCACSQSINAAASGEGSIGNVSVKITGPDGEIICEDDVGINSGSTVFDATVYVLRQAKITFDYTGIGKSAYISGINGIYEFDYGAMSGWLYFVNDDTSQSNVSCGAYELKDGDSIRWIYTKDGGADTGML